MEQQNKQIGFILRGIKTEQFATFEDVLTDAEQITGGFEIKYAASIADKIIVAYTKFTFFQNNNPFIVIEVSCHFAIEEQSFSTMLDEENKKIVIPKDFAAHLVMLTIGTTRGVLHAKVENTSYNQFLVPTINLTELIKEDAVITF